MPKITKDEFRKANRFYLETPQQYSGGDLAELFCLSTLIAVGELPHKATVADGEKKFGNLGMDCNNCAYTERCLACETFK